MEDKARVAPKRVLICSAAWKEALTPVEANTLIAASVQKHFPHWQIQTFPMSDGGDGWLEVMALARPQAYAWHTLEVTGPLPGQQVTARYLLTADGQQALLEAAEIHGMRRLPEGKREVMAATSYGVGQAFQQLDAQHPGLRQIILSVGGSASVDGGIGFLQALGWRFEEARGQPIAVPIGGGGLNRIQRVKPITLPSDFPEVILLADVETHYQEAPRVFGPQKGATAEQVGALTQGFTHIIGLIDPDHAVATRSGSGAAGGLPFGVGLGCPRVSVMPGSAWTAEAVGLLEALPHADWLITGEGRWDDTSLLGKGTGYLVRQARQWHIPVLVVCGQSTLQPEASPDISVLALYPPTYPVTPPDLASTQTTLAASLEANLSAIGQRLASPPA